MGKIYKGWELMKAIADGKIKERSRFKAEYETFIARDGYLFVEYDNRQKYANSFELKWKFELIEDEINIDSIEELNDTWYDVNTMSDDDLEFYHNKTRATINEILQSVKQIDKRVKKIEEK